MPKWYQEFRDGILNFEPGMMLWQNSWVFIVFGTVTPSVRERWGCLKESSAKVCFKCCVFLGNCIKSEFLWLYCVSRITGSP